jgi:hypothetical protein
MPFHHPQVVISIPRAEPHDMEYEKLAFWELDREYLEWNAVLIRPKE